MKFFITLADPPLPVRRCRPPLHLRPPPFTPPLAGARPPSSVIAGALRALVVHCHWHRRAGHHCLWDTPWRRQLEPPLAIVPVPPPALAGRQRPPACPRTTGCTSQPQPASLAGQPHRQPSPAALDVAEVCFLFLKILLQIWVNLDAIWLELIEFGWNLIMLDWNWVNLTKVNYVILNLCEIWLCYIEFEWNLIMLHWIGLKFD
jgi:hypothetical protein